MKNLILGFCLVGLAVACKSNDTLSVDDASNANLPAAECGGGGCESACDAKADCSGAKADCSASKAECSGAKSECSTKQVCPVTGKEIN